MRARGGAMSSTRVDHHQANRIVGGAGETP
jgi:hypothetical protein